jgi:hypothetical protein
VIRYLLEYNGIPRNAISREYVSGQLEQKLRMLVVPLVLFCANQVQPGIFPVLYVRTYFQNQNEWPRSFVDIVKEIKKEKKEAR